MSRGTSDAALRSLQRCKPARPPVYRKGDLYALDPHDDGLDLWAFRLGLRPPRAAQVRIVRPEPPPLPGVEVPLSIDELTAAWADGGSSAWSARRLALAVLDAHESALAPSEIFEFIAVHTGRGGLREDSFLVKRRDSPIRVEPDGRWALDPSAEDALPPVRKLVRARLETLRRHQATRPDRVVIKAQQEAAERRSAAHARELAALSRALLVAFPPKAPRAVALLDVKARTLETFLEQELDALRERLAGYDLLAAVEVRALLDALGCASPAQRLAELGPSQKSMKLNKRGRTLKITTAMLVQGSCNIGRPFGDPKKLAAYLEGGEESKLRRRLEADAKSLHALYAYGRLHGSVRLRWGFLDEFLPAPWVHRDEPRLYRLKQTALEAGAPLEIVTGSAPGWEEPWSRARRARVERNPSGWGTWLVGDDGLVIDDAEVQLARVVSGRM